jgi:hypothetical protein
LKFGGEQAALPERDWKLIEPMLLSEFFPGWSLDEIKRLSYWEKRAAWSLVEAKQKAKS